MPYFSRLVHFARVSQRFDKTNLIINCIKECLDTLRQICVFTFLKGYCHGTWKYNILKNCRFEFCHIITVSKTVSTTLLITCKKCHLVPLCL